MSTNEQLSVRQFGPVQQADISLRDLVVFVGPQASGKSLIAQLLFFMMWMELEIPASCVDQRSLAKERGRKFSVNPLTGGVRVKSFENRLQVSGGSGRPALRE
jgi:predicted ATPase